MTSGSSHLTLAHKINRLFELHPRGGKPPSNEEVAAAINAQGGPSTISASYLWLLRSGKRDNPTAHHLQALAQHFGVSPAYFFDDVAASEIEREMDLILAMRDAGVKQLALRAAGLRPEVVAAFTVMVEQARKVEGLGVVSEADAPAGDDSPAAVEGAEDLS